MPSSLPRIRASPGLPSRRLSKRARIVRSVGMTSGPTWSITTSAWPSTTLISAVMASVAVSTSRSEPVIAVRIRPARYAAIQGARPYWTRWVSSCRQTHSQKSSGSSPSL